ncbi:phenylalanine--tRNA ligase subunit alpha [Methanobrevibacter filiformis]|nr:MarR family transcriptional regulator [Methanobrevibacter filiformis]
MSKHRTKVLYSLEEENRVNESKLKRPSEISHETQMPLSDVSRALRGLKENSLVKCLNEDEKQGRLYELTKLGKKVLKNI